MVAFHFGASQLRLLIFSVTEYRAKLYSRLENKKQRLLIRENKPFNEAMQGKNSSEVKLLFSSVFRT